MIKKLAWEIDLKNSAIRFNIKWFERSAVTGEFSRFRAIVKADQLFNQPEIHLLIEAGSAVTPGKNWNEFLNNSDFLAANLFPYIEFASVGSCFRRGGDLWELIGDLSIKGTTKNLTMIVNASEIKKEKSIITAVFHLMGTISRYEYVLTCPTHQDLSDEVQLSSVITLTSVIA